MPGEEPDPVDPELLRKKATAQGGFTRVGNALERLVANPATPVSLLESTFQDMKTRFESFENQCNAILDTIDEAHPKYDEISKALDVQYTRFVDLDGQVVARKEEKTKTTVDTTSELVKSFKSHLNLPTPQVHKFDGSANDYSRFIAYLETHVESTVTENKHRLSVLVDSCSGLAYEAVNALIQCKDSDASYLEAKNILKTTFGSKSKVTRSVVADCVDGSAIRSHDIPALQKLIVLMRKAEITLKANDCKEELTSQEKLVKIYQRLPKHLQYKWNDKVVQIQDKDQKPSFEHMRELIEKHVRAQDNEYAASNSKVHVHVDSKRVSSKPVLSVSESVQVCSM